MENIFSVLNKYKVGEQITPLENFFTESLRFILRLDKELLNDFVRKITEKKFKLFKAPFILDTQTRHGSSIIDLQITDRRKQKIFIEIKVNARENRYYDKKTKNDFGQVQKYLDLEKGYVCFLAKDQSDIKIKRHRDKFLGKFEWFEIYKIIDEFGKNNNRLDKNQKYFINNFLNFMKKLDMQPCQEFDKTDIALSKTNFLGFNEKLIAFLKQVDKDKRINRLLDKHKLRVIRNTPKFSSKDNLFYLFLGRDVWSWHKRIELGFALYLDEENHKDGLYYYQCIAIWKNNLAEKFKNSIKLRKINKIFFEKQPDEINWPIYKDICFDKFIKPGKEKKAITYIYNSLLELEGSGILDILKKLR